MSMQNLEQQILAEAKQVFNNPKLQRREIIEWSSDEKTVEKNLVDGEVMAALPIGVWVCIAKSRDKREAALR